MRRPPRCRSVLGVEIRRPRAFSSSCALLALVFVACDGGPAGVPPGTAPDDGGYVWEGPGSGQDDAGPGGATDGGPTTTPDGAAPGFDADVGGQAPDASGADAGDGTPPDASADAAVEAGGGPGDDEWDAACDTLLSDPGVNWRQSALQTDQEIVTCLARSLGRPVGYGEKALGGYDPEGGSRLTVISQEADVSVEQQVADAVRGPEHNWIVFDKEDFAEPTAVALYRLHCADADVQSALDVDDAAGCVDYAGWCSANGVSSDACLQTFFNDRLDDGDLPIRNIPIGSNTTIDGRQSQAYFLFNGFAIGSDSDGEPVETSSSVILTNLLFQGAGHTEDHGLDPDMVRSTGASHDIWIHQNTFDLTGDSAFDVKVGAHDITMSFNRVQNVKRASLHGSSDSREINGQITTTMHHNLFITTDDLYDAFGNTGRRVPLARRGKAHLFNNVFYGYRKDVLSVRVGARVAVEDTLFLANPAAIGDDDLDYFAENLLRDFREGGLRVTGSYVALASSSYQLMPSAMADLSASLGSTPDLQQDYSQVSRDALTANRLAGQQLVDYLLTTTGKGGEEPFNVEHAGP